MNITGEKQINQCPYNPGFGDFGIDIGIITWYSCREQFHKVADLCYLDNYYYCTLNLAYHKQQILQIAAFIYKIEDHLHIEDKSSFMYTNKPNIIFIARMSPFWLEQAMRFSFFTIALRAGSNYRGENDWLPTLMANPYMGQTEYAVRKFLSGYTDYNGNTVGWHKQFVFSQGTQSLLQPEPPELRHHKKSQIAHSIWEKNGKPTGCDLAHWQEATIRYYLGRV